MTTAKNVLSILESLEETQAQENANEITEAAPKKVKVFRAGKKVTKLACPAGFKVDGTKCVKMSAQELRTRSKAAIKSARKRRGKNAQAARKRAKTMAKRASAGL